MLCSMNLAAILELMGSAILHVAEHTMVKFVSHKTGWHFFILYIFFMGPSTSGDAATVRMYQVEDGPRAIGSYVTVISDITNGSHVMEVILTATVSASNSSLTIGNISIQKWSDKSEDMVYQRSFIDYLNIRFLTTSDLTRRISWNFSFLAASYDELELGTHVITYLPQSTTRKSSHLVLHVTSCMSPSILATRNQNSSYAIDAKLNGHFNDVGICSCLHRNQVLVDISGTKLLQNATCSLYAQWIGCENAQCWSGPQNVSVLQHNTTVNVAPPFDCSFIEGFPNAYTVAYRIDNLIIPNDYVLKSYDNGRYLSCEVYTPFTEMMNRPYTSSNISIAVFYPPEQSSLSNDSIVIWMNDSFLLNYTFFVNPLPQGGGFQITIQGQPWSGYSGLFSLKHNYSRSTHHIYEIQVNVTSYQDYGVYNICSSTERPPGKDCTALTILNIVAPIPTISVTTDTAIGLIVLGILLLTVITISVSFYVFRRRKGSLRDGNATDDLNIGNTEYAVYGLTKGPEPIPNSERVELHEPNPGYELVKPNSGNEEVVLHEQSSGYDEVQTCHQNMHYEEITTQRSNTGYESVMHSAGYENVVIHASYERVD